MTSNSDILVTLRVNNADIRLRFFPDKSPINVANFLNLIEREFYDGSYFHSALHRPPYIVQGGCPESDSSSQIGYTVPHEVDNGLTLSHAGIVAMAHHGIDSATCEFFITMTSTPWLTKEFTIIGETLSDEDNKVLKSIRKGSVIQSVKILSDWSAHKEKYKDHIDNWNKILDQNYPRDFRKISKSA